MTPQGRRRYALLLALASGCAHAAPAEKAASVANAAETTGDRAFVYVALATGDVVAFALNSASGALSRRGSAPAGRAPTSLARSAERQLLVATDEVSGAAVSLAVNPRTGALSSVNRVATGGAAPSEVTIDRTGKYALVANSGSDSAAVLAIKPAGALQAGEVVAAGDGARAVAIHPANQVVFVANARAGTISQFSFNTGTGVLTPKPGPALSLPAGAAPTRFACHPSGRWVYVLNEADDTIAVHVFDEDIGALSLLASQIISTVPSEAAAKKNRPGDLRLGRGGKFLYATNRGHDSVVTYAIDGTGALTLVGHQPSGGRTPVALAVDPGGDLLLVANSGGRNVVVFRVDPTTGAPSPVRTVPLAAAPLSVLVVRP